MNLTKQLYRRFIKSIHALELSGRQAVPALKPEELRSRSSYYRSWTKENIYQHSDALGNLEQCRLVSIGEDKRVWLLTKYKVADSLPPFLALSEAKKRHEHDSSPSEAKPWSPSDSQ